jgi:Lrp/AsnC family leucine-responsive transcriptional regulator
MRIEEFSDELTGDDLPKRSTTENEPSTLDAIDQRILAILQRDSLIANQDLADRVGLSPPACFKRVRRLRARRIITGTVALIAPEAVGYPVLVMARVKLERPRDEMMREFERKMAALPPVIQCLTVAGDIDYIIVVRARDIADYQAFSRTVFATDPSIRSYTSEIVLEVAKWTTEVPLDIPSMLDGQASRII